MLVRGWVAFSLYFSPLRENITVCGGFSSFGVVFVYLHIYLSFLYVSRICVRFGNTLLRLRTCKQEKVFTVILKERGKTDANVYRTASERNIISAVRERAPSIEMLILEMLKM